MDSTQIEALLEKYWEGNSSLAEEKQIRQYFQSQASIPDNLKAYQVFFMEESSRLRTSELPPLFESDDASEWLAWLGPNKPMKLHILQTYKQFIYISASVLLLLGSWALWQSPSYSDSTQMANAEYTAQSKKEAYEEVKRAMSIFSKGYQQGQSHIQLVEPLNEAVIVSKNSIE